MFDIKHKINQGSVDAIYSEDVAIRELVLATLKLSGGGKYKTYLSTTLIHNFFPSVPLLKNADLEKALTSLHQKHILSYKKVLNNKKTNTACYYRVRINNGAYVYYRHSFHYANILKYFSSQTSKSIDQTPKLRLIVDFPPNTVNAKLSVLVSIEPDSLTNYIIPVKTTCEKSGVWKYLSLHQKEKVSLASIVGDNYYKGGSEYVSRMICGGKQRNGVKSERIAQVFLQGFNMHNEQYVIANFSPTTQELLDNRKLALKSEQDIQTLVEDIARFCK